MWKNMVQPDRPHNIIWRTRFARCITKATHTHTQRTCNTYCFSTAIIVQRTRLNITFIRPLPVLLTLNNFEHNLKLLYKLHLEYAAFAVGHFCPNPVKPTLFHCYYALHTSDTSTLFSIKAARKTSFTTAHNDKSQGIKSGDCGGRGIASPQPKLRKAEIHNNRVTMKPYS